MLETLNEVGFSHTHQNSSSLRPHYVVNALLHLSVEQAGPPPLPRAALFILAAYVIFKSNDTLNLNKHLIILTKHTKYHLKTNQQLIILENNFHILITQKL